MGMDVQVDNGGKKGSSKPEMNVTPLVDVVLVLLIIFMVVMPVANAHLWLHVPEQNDRPQNITPPPPGEEPIVVNVTADGQIRINRTVYSDQEFPERLHRMLVARGERKIFFDAHDDARYQRVVATIDLAREAGATEVAVSPTALPIH